MTIGLCSTCHFPVFKRHTNVGCLSGILLIRYLECQEALGMETGIISDGQLSASSEFGATCAAMQGRLHCQETVDKAGGWAVATNDANQWLQVDLGKQLAKVTRVATQGRNGHYIQLVTKYKLQYSNDGVNFQNYTEQEGNIAKVLNVRFWSVVKYFGSSDSTEVGTLACCPVRFRPGVICGLSL